MSDYIRSKIEGGTYFFTVVTFNRMPIFNNSFARKWLKTAFQKIQQKYPFKIIAICLLPEHLHCIWQLPKNDKDYSIRWKGIKGLFTKYYLLNGGKQGNRNKSRIEKREAAVWQRRYWEHTIIDEDDLLNHIDYIHFNPVKHGYVNHPGKWPWTSFHKFTQLGYYEDFWGLNEPLKI